MTQMFCEELRTGKYQIERYPPWIAVRRFIGSAWSMFRPDLDSAGGRFLSQSESRPRFIGAEALTANRRSGILHLVCSVYKQSS